MADAIVETDRLILRDWREEDWAPFWRHTNTPNVMRWLGGVADEEGLAAIRLRLDGFSRDWGHTFWVVERRTDAAILGFCGLKRANVEGAPVFGRTEIGWRFREDAWGQGFAREAASASLELGFEKFGASEIVALTVEGNTASWGLMRRLGMTRREDLDYHDARWGEHLNPTIVYTITAQQWKARTA